MASVAVTSRRELLSRGVSRRIAESLGQHDDDDAAKRSASRWWWITHAADVLAGVERQLAAAVLQSHPDWESIGSYRQQHLLHLLHDLLAKPGLTRLMTCAMLLAQGAPEELALMCAHVLPRLPSLVSGPSLCPPPCSSWDRNTQQENKTGGAACRLVRFRFLFCFRFCFFFFLFAPLAAFLPPPLL